MRTFHAYYEDYDKAMSLAAKQGWSGDEDSLYDFVDYQSSRCRVSQDFMDLSSATNWLIAEIAKGRSVYGTGTILEIETVSRGGRCRYCTCQGEREVHRWWVSNEIDGHESVDECCDE